MKKIFHTMFVGLVEFTNYDFGALILMLSLFWMVALLLVAFSPNPITVLCIIGVTGVIVLSFYFLKREIEEKSKENNKKSD